ncbi:DUF4064 domain-containing protein [Virgibacillus oceani]
MKRTAEKITGVIGIVGFILIAGLVLLFSAIVSSDDFQSVMSEEVDGEMAGEGISEEELSDFIEQMETANYTLDIGLLLAFVLAGVAALFLLKKKPILSAIIFFGSAITAAVVFWSMILPIVPALLYLTSAIIILLRGRSKADSHVID